MVLIVMVPTPLRWPDWARLKTLLDLNPVCCRQSRNGVRITQLRREIVRAGYIVPVGNVLSPQRDFRIPIGNFLSYPSVEQTVASLNRIRRGIRIMTVRLIVHLAAIGEIDCRVQRAEPIAKRIRSR